MARPTLSLALAALAFCGALAPAPLLAKGGAASEQLQFGVRMAQRGLWNEALFRFQQALRVEPDNARILNNMAVAYEAVGNYEQALETYQKGLALSPSNSELKRNYTRFLEFYQSFKTPSGQAQDTAPELPEARQGGAGDATSDGPAAFR